MNLRVTLNGLAGSKRRFSYFATVVSGMSDAPDDEVRGAGPDSWRTSRSCINGRGVLLTNEKVG